MFLSGALLLFIISSLLTGQCLYYQFQIQSYRQISYESQAKALYNLARINQLAKGQKLNANLGQVINQGDKYRIILKNQWVYFYPS